tara:strand:- start:418 stop:795 length:378 start_codon:yes stop_codon:yes gene_type:complete
MSGCDMDIVEWMEECYRGNAGNVIPESVDIKDNGLSIQLSNTVKVDKKGKRMGKSSINKGYKRIIFGSNIMIDGPIDGIWSTPRAKALKVSNDGKNYEYLGDKGKWIQFIKNNDLITNFSWVPQA